MWKQELLEHVCEGKGTTDIGILIAHSDGDCRIKQLFRILSRLNKTRKVNSANLGDTLQGSTCFSLPNYNLAFQVKLPIKQLNP